MSKIDHMHEAPLLLVVCGLRDWPFRVPPEQRIGLAPPNYGAIYPCVVHLDVPYVVITLTE